MEWNNDRLTFENKFFKIQFTKRFGGKIISLILKTSVLTESATNLFETRDNYNHLISRETELITPLDENNVVNNNGYEHSIKHFGLFSTQIWQNSHFHNTVNNRISTFGYKKPTSFFKYLFELIKYYTCRGRILRRRYCAKPIRKIELKFERNSNLWSDLNIEKLFKVYNRPYFDLTYNFEFGSYDNHLNPTFWITNSVPRQGNIFVQGPYGVMNLTKNLTKQYTMFEPSNGWIGWCSNAGGILFSLEYEKVRSFRIRTTDQFSIEWTYRKKDNDYSTKIRVIPFYGLTNIDGASNSGLVEFDDLDADGIPNNVKIFPTFTKKGAKIEIGDAEQEVDLKAGQLTNITLDSGLKTEIRNNSFGKLKTEDEEIHLLFNRFKSNEPEIGVYPISNPDFEFLRGPESKRSPPKLFNYNKDCSVIGKRSKYSKISNTKRLRILALVNAQESQYLLSLSRQFDVDFDIPFIPNYVVNYVDDTSNSWKSNSSKIEFELGDRHESLQLQEIHSNIESYLNKLDSYDLIITEAGFGWTRNEINNPVGNPTTATSAWYKLSSNHIELIKNKIECENSNIGIIIFSAGNYRYQYSTDDTDGNWNYINKLICQIQIEKDSSIINPTPSSYLKNISWLGSYLNVFNHYDTENDHLENDPTAILEQDGNSIVATKTRCNSRIIEVGMSLEYFFEFFHNEYLAGIIRNSGTAEFPDSHNMHSDTSRKNDLMIYSSMLHVSGQDLISIERHKVNSTNIEFLFTLDFDDNLDLNIKFYDRFNNELGQDTKSRISSHEVIPHPNYNFWYIEINITNPDGNIVLLGYLDNEDQSDYILSSELDDILGDSDNLTSNYCIQILDGGCRILYQCEGDKKKINGISLPSFDFSTEIRIHEFNEHGKLLRQGVVDDYKSTVEKVKSTKYLIEYNGTYNPPTKNLFLDHISFLKHLGITSYQNKNWLGLSASQPYFSYMTRYIIGLLQKHDFLFNLDGSGLITVDGTGTTWDSVNGDGTNTWKPNSNFMVNSNFFSPQFTEFLRTTNYTYIRVNADEPPNYTSWSKKDGSIGLPIDYCFSTISFEKFREYLEGKYGDIGNLNLIWKNAQDYQSFNEIEPDEIFIYNRAIESVDNFPPYLDLKLFNILQYSNSLGKVKDNNEYTNQRIGELSPKFGFVHVNSNWKLKSKFNNHTVYNTYPVVKYIKENSHENIAIATTAYDDPFPLINNRIMTLLGHGADGMMLWKYASNLNRDYSLPEIARDTIALLEQVSNGVGLLFKKSVEVVPRVLISQSIQSSIVSYVKLNEINEISDKNKLLTYETSLKGAMSLLNNLAIPYKMIDMDDFLEKGEELDSSIECLILPFNISLKGNIKEVLESMTNNLVLISDLLPGYYDENGLEHNSLPLADYYPIIPDTFNLINVSDDNSLNIKIKFRDANDESELYQQKEHNSIKHIYFGKSLFREYKGIGSAVIDAANNRHKIEALMRTILSEENIVSEIESKLYNQDEYVKGVYHNVRQYGAAKIYTIRRNYDLIYWKSETFSTSYVEGEVHLLHKNYIYDVLLSTFLGRCNRIKVFFTPYTNRIFTSLPYRVIKLSTDIISNNIFLGNHIDIGCTLVILGSSSKDIQHIINVQVFHEESGSNFEFHNQTFETEKGALNFNVTIKFAYNDLPGNYIIQVKDVLTGVCSEKIRIELNRSQDKNIVPDEKLTYISYVNE